MPDRDPELPREARRAPLRGPEAVHSVQSRLQAEIAPKGEFRPDRRKSDRHKSPYSAIPALPGI